MTIFWLGTHMPNWLGVAGVPLFVSAVRLRGRKTYPKAIAPWALDSGGFSELQKHGWWKVGPRAYANEVREWSEKIGRMEWAAIQDWMCEDVMLKKTGRSITYHQWRTIASWFDLKMYAPEMPWVPVLQGYSYSDYFRHAAMYEAQGVRLAELPIVGIGSVCRRQDTKVAEEVIRDLREKLGIRLHGFGFKLGGLYRSARDLESADSMAWSFSARNDDPLPGCAHSNCNSCLAYAMMWREKVMDRINHGSIAPRYVSMF